MKGISSTPPRRSPSSDGTRRLPWENVWLRLVVSVVVLAHLVAVASAPFAVLASGFGQRATTPGPPPPMDREANPSRPSDRPLPVILRFSQAILPYLDLLYLNHGYSFFAPEPSASYVIDYEIEREDGQTVRGRLPDVERHWPRLLYHRYFMLSSQNLELTERAVADGKVPPGSTDTLNYAIARHLHEVEGGKRSVLRLLIHRLLWPEDVLRGKSLQAEDTYELVGEIGYPPPAAPELRPAAVRGDTISIAEEVDP